MNSFSSTSKRWIQAGLLLLLFLGAVGMRRHVLNAQRDLSGDGSLPFSLESALAFRRIQMVYRDGELPQTDRGIQYPEGVVTREVDTMGAEQMAARAAKAWPGTLKLEEKVRWLHLLWFCLGIPALFFWVKWMGGGGLGGFWAAAFYAVAITAVARSTGQELSHENNAMPLLLWHLAAGAWARKGARGSRSRILWGWVSALLAGLALCAWDLVQYYLMMLMVWNLLQALRGRFTKEDLWGGAVPLMAVLFAVGLRNPYLAAHHFLLSPTMALGWAVLLAGAPMAQRQRKTTRVVLALIPIGILLACAHLFFPSYSHFASLFWAKLRFFNMRPLDPALLTFDQRILWVPALNSTSWHLLWKWFPCLLLLTGAAIWALIRCTVRRRCAGSEFSSLLFYFAVSLFTFILFFRFHVWLVVFACALLGLGVGLTIPRAGRWVRWVWIFFLSAGWLMEAAQSWQDPHRWGRPNVYATEMQALMQHLRKYAAPEPVLANFGISASIATYGGCPVVLHPKFESPEIRKTVQEYGETLFRGSEREFCDWMEAKGATIYVHSMGEFATLKPEYQMRYMVNTMDPATHAAARLFEQRPDELEYFVPQFANRKYRVYRLKDSPVSDRWSETLVTEARQSLEAGELELAEVQAAHALRLDAENEEAQSVLRHAGSLRNAGFRETEEDAVVIEPLYLAPANPW
jgi:hypothetical protein